MLVFFIYIIYKQKDPELISGPLYVSAEAVKLRFTGILLMFEQELFKILKIISENKKDPEGPFLYKYFFNVQFAYSSGAVNCVHRYITLFKYVVVKK